ncbi:response regulator [soil metagenome]
MGSPLLSILLVEDDEIDRELFIRCLGRQEDRLNITIASDAAEALAILQGRPEHPALGRPYVILLDLSLPGISSFEFLQIVRQDPALKRSTVFVLTASDNPQDKVDAYNYNVAGFISKEQLDTQCSQLIEMFEIYRRINFSPSQIKSE